MTATILNRGTENQAGGVGRIARVTGPVVDIEFPADSMPDMYNMLKTEVDLGGETTTLTLEVALHIGDGMVRAISMQPTDGLVRGSQVQDTGGPITVPVGDVTKGHVFNALGEPLDVQASQPEITQRWPIHRHPPPFGQPQAKTEMFGAGIKGIGPLTP